MTGPSDVQAMADAYERTGFAVLPGALPAALVAEVRDACDRAWAGGASVPTLDATRRYRRRTVEGREVDDRLDPVVDLDPVLERLVEDPLMTEPAAAVIGEPVRLLKSKLIRKGPGVDGYGPHQDGAYYRHAGVDLARCTSVLVPLDPFDAEAGPLEVVEGSHGSVLPVLGGTEDPEPAALVGCRWAVPRLEPGDLGFLHPLALHRSAPNRTAGSRRILFLTYVGAAVDPEAAARLQNLYVERFKPAIDAGGSGCGAVEHAAHGRLDLGR
jgi:ectoine hydroxylase-related dioxygenase (phytanoyl-CoA dioxygenase family)